MEPKIQIKNDCFQMRLELISKCSKSLEQGNCRNWRNSSNYNIPCVKKEFGNKGKCKGENIKLVIERNNLNDVVYVGDTHGDYESTIFAQIPFRFTKCGLYH